MEQAGVTILLQSDSPDLEQNPFYTNSYPCQGSMAQSMPFVGEGFDFLGELTCKAKSLA
jgi:hypothetical protein